ncbi:MAG: SusC/RagA family TonB-linked outer membrane protein, partial [Bacteroidales bacterium]
TNIPVLSGDQLPMFGFGSTRAFEIANNMWQMYNKSDLRVVSADHVRLRTASIRYQIPENLCKKAGLGNAYVKFEGNNLLLFASKKLRGQDPDQISLGGQTSPLLPSYSVSIDITF